MSTRAALAACVLLAACSQDDQVAGPPDAARHHDAAVVDAAIDMAIDTNPPDAVILHEPSGLPCDVAAVLANECTVCHAQPVEGGAPVPLLTLADLMVPISGTTMNMAQYCLSRMMDGSMPPLPAAPVTSAELATFQSWINAGTPGGTTACPPASPYDGTARCTSGTMWTLGNASSPSMHPGLACIGCHTTSTPQPTPVGTMAGTVYRTVHEPDDCNGAASTSADPITVSVFDIDGHTITATANAVGNFFSSDPIHLPIQYATVTYQGRTRAMASGQVSADCNSCHTEGGTLGAPGRIVAP